MSADHDDSVDELDRALNALRALEPPPARPTLRDAIVHDFPAVRAPRTFDLRRIAASWIAAAAVTLCAIGLARRDVARSADEPVASDVAVAPSTNALLLDLDALARRIERLPPPPTPAPPVYDAPEQDPDFSRLVIARGYEAIDTDRARERYRVLASTTPDGPVRDVALARLEALTP
jgi:hypothetical protein